MKNTNVEYNNKILNCIIDICESHPPKYDNLGLESELFISDDFFMKNIKKYFSIEEINSYKGKEQIIHDYKEFANDDLFYKKLLDDFKLYMYNIISRKKKLVLIYPDNDNEFNESLFNNNISFIYFYNMILFMKEISNKFPQVMNENIYKIDLILMISIFSPDYRITFENGVEDKYGINYESYSILMIELIDLIKEKKYEGYNNIIEIEKYEFKYPKNWNFFINQIETKILEFFFFKNYIIKRKYDDFLFNKYLSNTNEETDLSKYYSQIKQMYNKFNENKNLNMDKIKNNLNEILNKISKSKSFDDKKKVIKEILDNININDNYKLLNENNILSNLEILYEFYSLDKNEIILQLIYSFELIDNLGESKNRSKFKSTSFLDFIKKRKRIIHESKEAKNFTKEFKDILNDEDFRNKMCSILNSSVVKNYYENPKYYLNNNSEIIKLIGDKEFIEIYNTFIENFIKNNKIYDKIIFKRMPFGIKGGATSFLYIILDPFDVDINSNIKDKNYYLETYLIIIFLHETNHFSKRSFYMNKPLSFCRTPQNYEGGDSIIFSLFGEEKICIINLELCNKVNDLNSWNAKTLEEIKTFKKSLKSLIKEMNLKDINEEKLIEIKNKQNCLISFSNYKNKNVNGSIIKYSGNNSGFFRF